MNIQANAGILYPKDPEVTVRRADTRPALPLYITVPHGEWSRIRQKLDDAFYSAGLAEPQYVFVLAPLHAGKLLDPDTRTPYASAVQDFCIYTYENCPVHSIHDTAHKKKLLTENNEICSEEYSFEILLPHIKAYFPNAQYTAFYAPEYNPVLADFIDELEKEYPRSLFIVSEENCKKPYWTQALELKNKNVK